MADALPVVMARLFPSNVRLASPIRALLPVTVATVLLVLPLRLTPPPVAAIVTAPVPFVIEMPDPAVSVALARVFPVVFPMSSCPLV